MGQRHRVAFDLLNAILFGADPVGIAWLKDEYEPEVGSILPRLRHCCSKEEVQQVVHEEFVDWFNREGIGPFENYAVIAERIWNEVLPLLERDDADTASAS